MEIPGVGLLSATALVASVAHIHGFRRASSRAGWGSPLGKTRGDRRHLGAITKQGDVYLRCLLTHGARAVLLAARRAARLKRPLTWRQQWAVADRRGHNRATVAVANTIARLVWAVWSRERALRGEESIR